jgi:hypothetical protein
MSIPVSPNDDDEFICRTLDDLLAYVDALRAAAGKVTCWRCLSSGIVRDTETNMGGPCPDCSELRALLPEEKRS